VGIRAIGERFAAEHLRQAHRRDERGRIFREAFSGAIYLHRGSSTGSMNLTGSEKAICSEVKVNYYTQPLSTGTTEVLKKKRRGDAKIFHCIGACCVLQRKSFLTIRRGRMIM
jgi:hypothetical protein